jgi:hypothetical protein
MIRSAAIAAAACAAVTAALVLLVPDPRGRSEPVREAAAEGPEAGPPAAVPRAPASRPRVVTRAAERTAAAAAPHRGVRGIVASPRVRRGDGSPGVDPARWELTVYALVDRPARRAVDRIGIVRRRGAVDATGAFGVDLPTGRYLVLVQHAASAEGLTILEAWYAYADVDPSDLRPRDLGRHEFGAAVIRGCVRDPDGAPVAGVPVDCSDESRSPGDALTRGVHLRVPAASDGRFALSLARADGTSPVVRLAARHDDLEGTVHGVRPGDVVELALGAPEPTSEVALAIPWSASQRVWVHALDRRLGFMVEGGRAPPSGIVEERRRLPLGRYAVLVQRAGPAGGEWARSEFAVEGIEPLRVALEPAFRPARTIVGTSGRATVVEWVTRASDGSTFVQGRAAAGPDGRFELRDVPTDGILLRAGAALIPVAAADERETRVRIGESH